MVAVPVFKTTHTNALALEETDHFYESLITPVPGGAAHWIKTASSQRISRGALLEQPT
jgi:hypothetical protein